MKKDSVKKRPMTAAEIRGEKRINKYLRIEKVGMTPSGLTAVWRVYNFHHDQVCGHIRWHGGFRKYAFFPSDGFRFDSDCLRFVADFMDTRLKMKKEDPASSMI